MKIETGEKNEILRKVSEKIRKDEIKKYVSIGRDMIKYLKDPNNQRVGLAGPQIGINKRIIAVSLLKSWDDKNFQTIMMINPEIIEFSDDYNIENESCLSIPGKTGKVKRSNNIKISFLDEKGNEKVLKLGIVSSRIVQHEIDHLNGILFTDKILDLKKE